MKDQAGHSFIPFTSTFSTGDFTNLKIDPRYRYAVIDPPVWNGTPIDSLVFGPDGRLYGTDLLGIVRRWTVAPDGSLLNEEQWADLAGRTLIGIVFQPDNPNVFWVTTNAPVYIQPAQDLTGTVTKVTIDPLQPGFVATWVDMVSGLPRSAKDHMTNSLAFGPDGALYVTEGSTTGSGAQDPTWYNRSERLLSSALLRIDLTLLTEPINVQTQPLPPPEFPPDGGVDGGVDEETTRAPLRSSGPRSRRGTVASTTRSRRARRSRSTARASAMLMTWSGTATATSTPPRTGRRPARTPPALPPACSPSFRRCSASPPRTTSSSTW